MIDVELLRRKIDENGVLFRHVAKKAGLSRQAFWKKMKRGQDFKVANLEGIRAALKLTDSEFLELFNGKKGEPKNE